jgi:hypothetical protein
LKGKDGGRSAQTCLGISNWRMSSMICVVGQFWSCWNGSWFVLFYLVLLPLDKCFILGLFYFTTRASTASTTSGRSRTGMAQWYYVQLTRGVGSAWSGLALLRSSCPVSLPMCRIQARGPTNGSSLFLW